MAMTPETPRPTVGGPTPTTTTETTSTTTSSGYGPQHQIIAVFETHERALAARDRLIDEGIPSSEIEVLNRDAMTGATDAARDEGIWASIRRFFLPEEDTYAYAEGLRRGHAVLAVRPRVEERERVITIIESFEPIDFDTRLEEWRKEGWTGRPDYAGVQPPPYTATSGVGRTETRVDETLAGTAARATASGTGRVEETIPVVEEDVRIGKRAVDRGGVRVRSYVIERPVTEDVTLREERVDVERRPVDRPADVPGDAFRERTIEATAYGEEPVVQKDARVVEEVGIRKEAEERTERVTETARKTEVEVEDTREDKKRGV